MQIILDPGISPIYKGILLFFFVINLGLAFIIIFLDRDRRDATATWAWLLLLFVMPIFGFIMYIFLGRMVKQKRALSISEGKLIEDDKQRVNQQLEDATDYVVDTEHQITKKHSDIVHTLLTREQSFLSNNNKVDIFTDGRKLFEQMKEDLRNAQTYIHMEYYILKLDGIGNEILEILEQKASEGLEVKLLYDAVGSKSLHKSRFKQFQQNGGQVEAFFKAVIIPVNFRINNRNHRKILVIDGHKGYVGGFNIGDEYLGKDKQIGEG